MYLNEKISFLKKGKASYVLPFIGVIVFAVLPLSGCHQLDSGKTVEIESLSIAGTPSTTGYTVGDTTFKLSGTKLNVVSTDGTTSQLSWTTEPPSAGWKVAGFNTANAGTKSVTIFYSGKIAGTVSITVSPKSASTIQTVIN
jgi:hypothetical protein